MSFGMGLIVSGGCFFASDSRQTNPITGEILADDVDKIRWLSNRILAISFGVVQATDMALSKLTNVPDVDPHEFLEILDLCVAHGWQVFQHNASPDIDVNKDSIKAGMIAGGISKGNTPFLAGVLYGAKGSLSSRIETKLECALSLGGEEFAPTEYFNSVLQGSTRVELVNATELTISYLTGLDPTIGGNARTEFISLDAKG